MKKNRICWITISALTIFLGFGCAANPPLSRYLDQNSADVGGLKVIADCYVNTFFETQGGGAALDRDFNNNLCEAIQRRAMSAVNAAGIAIEAEIVRGPVTLGGQLGGEFRVKDSKGGESASAAGSEYSIPQLDGQNVSASRIGFGPLMTDARKTLDKWRVERTNAVFNNGDMPTSYFSEMGLNRQPLSDSDGSHTLLIVTGGQLIADELDARTDSQYVAKQAAGIVLSALLTGGSYVMAPGGRNYNSGLFSAILLIDSNGTIIWNGFGGTRKKKTLEADALALVDSIGS